MPVLYFLIAIYWAVSASFFLTAQEKTGLEKVDSLLQITLEEKRSWADLAFEGKIPKAGKSQDFQVRARIPIPVEEFHSGQIPPLDQWTLFLSLNLTPGKLRLGSVFFSSGSPWMDLWRRPDYLAGSSKSDLLNRDSAASVSYRAVPLSRSWGGSLDYGNFHGVFLYHRDHPRLSKGRESLSLGLSFDIFRWRTARDIGFLGLSILTTQINQGRGGDSSWYYSRQPLPKLGVDWKQAGFTRRFVSLWSVGQGVEQVLLRFSWKRAFASRSYWEFLSSQGMSVNSLTSPGFFQKSQLNFRLDSFEENLTLAFYSFDWQNARGETLRARAGQTAAIRNRSTFRLFLNSFSKGILRLEGTLKQPYFLLSRRWRPYYEVRVKVLFTFSPEKLGPLHRDQWIILGELASRSREYQNLIEYGLGEELPLLGSFRLQISRRIETVGLPVWIRPLQRLPQIPREYVHRFAVKCELWGQLEQLPSRWFSPIEGRDRFSGNISLKGKYRLIISGDEDASEPYWRRLELILGLRGKWDRSLSDREISVKYSIGGAFFSKLSLSRKVHLEGRIGLDFSQSRPDQIILKSRLTFGLRLRLEFSAGLGKRLSEENVPVEEDLLKEGEEGESGWEGSDLSGMVIPEDSAK